MFDLGLAVGAFVTHAQYGDTIGNAFISHVIGAVAWRMWPINIAGLMMRAFMAINKFL
jgi:divalent metal cation (Fe/Co/Zn/Cd) transporter